MRKWLVTTIVICLVIAVPLGVIAATTQFRSRLERQRAVARSGAVATSNQDWRTVRGMRRLVCSIHEVSVAVSLDVKGAPVQFRILQDSGPTLEPGRARFDPDGTTSSFAYNFVGNTGTFEGLDDHVFELQWRSPTGDQVELRAASMNLLFEKGDCTL
ncbi:MAG: hypothetical protein ACR2LG_08200 [Actinomycetota bacterium]|nr:hypothetical protein [Actinomycetota bacterium]